MATSEDCASRFVRWDDESQRHMVFDLPATWWSRPYEYAWAAKFAAPGSVVVDVASGISHPFKWYLTTLAHEVYACDIDPRIVSEEATLQDIRADFGAQAATTFERSLLRSLHLNQCDMTSLPYRDRMFDTVYCISVLEHVGETARFQALSEFTRVMKDDGQIVLTVDYPTVDLRHLEESMGRLGLEFRAEHDFAIPENAISSSLCSS